MIAFRRELRLRGSQSELALPMKDTLDPRFGRIHDEDHHQNDHDESHHDQSNV
jgi:hypothetical protein